MIREWDCSKFLDKDLLKAGKDELLKDDAEEVQVTRPKMTPTPPEGFQVMFLAFIIHGLSFPTHDFLRGLLFAYGVQLHDLAPNTVLHIACFISVSWGSSPTGHCGSESSA
jgi:hypothetical protein